MVIWICLPVYNRKTFTLKCLKTIHRQSFRSFKVVVCDHGSTDGTSEAISKDYPSVYLLNADNSLWWTGAINVCVRHALQFAQPEDFILTLNDDTELPEDYLFRIAECAKKYPDSIITSVIYDLVNNEMVEGGYRQNWWLATSTLLSFKEDHVVNDPNVIEVSHASGRGTLFPISVFKKIGVFDEVHLPHYAADYDFAFKAVRAGFKIYISQNCRVLTHVDATGMTKVLKHFSLKSFLDYFTSIRSPANLCTRFWLGWNNCPKIFFPIYFIMDLIRVFGGFFKIFLYRM